MSTKLFLYKELAEMDALCKKKCKRNELCKKYYFTKKKIVLKNIFQRTDPIQILYN